MTVNGEHREVRVRATDILLDVLRDGLGLVGTNKVCAQGICGACTVIANGQAITACLALVAQLDGANITTIEGLERNGQLDPLQESFLRHGAVQCGYCTPGFLMAARAFLDENPSPTREEIVDALRGNICRCTGYAKIIEAVAAVAERNSTSSAIKVS
jgi:aerobic-type carbon monoxide dehydrogenase small subunit (CoxS/CutS family)